MRKGKNFVTEGHPQTPGNPDGSGLHSPFFISLLMLTGGALPPDVRSQLWPYGDSPLPLGPYPLGDARDEVTHLEGQAGVLGYGLGAHAV